MASIYSDINTSAKENFPLVTDIEAVIQSIDNYIKTRKGQRLFRPTLGSSLDKDLLFELAEEDAVLLAVTRITEDLERWDPRINVDPSTTVDIYPDDKRVDILLVFNVKGFGDQLITKNFSI